MATIAQRLRDDHGVAASESSVRRWIATHFAEEVARERVTVPRGPVDAGSEAQIDYGRLGMWFDPATARRVAVWAFVMVLAFSRHLIRASGHPNGPNRLVCLPCRRIRILRRGAGAASV